MQKSLWHFQAVSTLDTRYIHQYSKGRTHEASALPVPLQSVNLSCKILKVLLANFTFCGFEPKHEKEEGHLQECHLVRFLFTTMVPATMS